MDVLILFCHGVAGSGKSQLVRLIAEKFPFNDFIADVQIKWHIQCKDSGHDVREELKKLAEKLFKNAHVSLRKYQLFKDELESDVAGTLVEKLVECDVPVLLVIEDPDKNKDARILNDLFRSVDKNAAKSNAKSKFHVYVTSRTKFSLLSEDETLKMNSYRSKFVKGFSQQEAIGYLNIKSKDDENAAIKVFERFSGLPLGLQAAKNYCKKARISYSEYLDLVEDVDYNILGKEKEEITNEYGGSAEHVYQAIVMPFLPSNVPEENTMLHWKILSCLSYFHYDRIPRFALEQCCHLLREKKVKKTKTKNKADIGSLITKLLDYMMCTETDEGEITFHEVVQNSFRLNQHDVFHNSTFNPLEKAIEVMCSLVSKDMRKTDHSNKMYKIRRHLQALLGFVAIDEKLLEESEDAILLKALLSHLYETAASIMLGESPLCSAEIEDYFMKALDLIWEDASSLERPQDTFKMNDFAQTVVDTSIAKGKLLPQNFALNFSSKLEICFEIDELKFLESKSEDHQKFVQVKKTLDSMESTFVLLQKLQECNLFLSDKDHRLIFYAERVASILHSWSRSILFADAIEPSSVTRCAWMSSLSKSICVLCRKTCHVSLLLEYISESNGLIPIILKQKKNEKALREALHICQVFLSTKNCTKMFENGLLKEMFGPSSLITKIHVLKNVVRINTRMIAFDRNEQFLASADRECEELFALAEDTAAHITISTMCTIYCAKYYAAKQNYEKALMCYEKFFELIEKHDRPKFNVYCWAVYNYTRTALHHWSTFSRIDAKNKCEEVLCSKIVIFQSLFEHLKESFEKLEAVDVDKSMGEQGSSGTPGRLSDPPRMLSAPRQPPHISFENEQNNLFQKSELQKKKEEDKSFLLRFDSKIRKIITFKK